jgi:hypothetical protein
MTLNTLAKLQEWSLTASRAKTFLRQVLAATNRAGFDGPHDLFPRRNDFNNHAAYAQMNTDLAASSEASRESLPEMHHATRTVLWNLVSQTERDLSSEIIGTNFNTFDFAFFNDQDLGFDNCFPVFPEQMTRTN